MNLLDVAELVFIYAVGRDLVRMAIFFRMLLITHAVFVVSNFVPRAYSISYDFDPPILPRILTLFLNAAPGHASWNEIYQSVSLHAYPVSVFVPGI